MTAAVSPTVVGVFKDRSQAEEAVQDLRSAGFGADQVGLLARHAETPEGRGASSSPRTNSTSLSPPRSTSKSRAATSAARST